NLNVQAIPAYGLPGSANQITTTVGAFTVVDPANPVTFTALLNLDYLTFEGHVRIWVPDSTPLKQAINRYTISLDAWGGESAVWSGESAVWSGESAIWSGESAIWGGESAIWGGPSRAWGAPSVSPDGQLIIINTDDPFGPTGTGALQAIDTLPNLPAWFTLVGQAYRVQIRPGFTTPITRTIAFDYLQRQTPPGYETTLNIYVSYDEGQTWQPLPTTLDTDDNRAIALMDTNSPEGIYALIATLDIATFTPGWNLFGYPILETRSITSVLASINGRYTSVYHHNTSLNQWILYDQPTALNYPTYTPLVNDLDTANFGRVYWIYATEAVTLFVNVSVGQNLVNTNLVDTNINQLTTIPPATYYGPISGNVTAGMPITATINGNLCGSGTITNLNGSPAYKLQIMADTGNDCGLTNRTINFYINGQLVSNPPLFWQNNQAQYHPLTLNNCSPATTPSAVTATPNNLDILLTWTDTGADNYEIWTHTSPYTLPGSDCGLATNCAISSTNNYTAPNNAGDTATNYYYHIIATNSCGDRAPATPTIGEFDYTLTSGQ
ncbi:MAG TPA: hypothetical protein VLL52_24665, partial [Anaerolineae bacterium]|nr:hypothetical protein [Anaerolineae bacterium]